MAAKLTSQATGPIDGYQPRKAMAAGKAKFGNFGVASFDSVQRSTNAQGPRGSDGYRREPKA